MNNTKSSEKIINSKEELFVTFVQYGSNLTTPTPYQIGLLKQECFNIINTLIKFNMVNMGLDKKELQQLAIEYLSKRYEINPSVIENLSSLTKKIERKSS